MPTSFDLELRENQTKKMGFLKIQIPHQKSAVNVPPPARSSEFRKNLKKFEKHLNIPSQDENGTEITQTTRQIRRDGYTMIKRTSFALAAVAALGFLSVSMSAQAAGTLVHVTLFDSEAGMEVITDRNRAVAGPVSFAATNKSDALQHEMLVLKVSSDAPTLPYDTGTDRIPEDKIASLGEIPEIDPGEGGALTLELTKGTYLLFCNKPGHFHAGMKKLFYVE